jgi:hypothetical protein
METIGWVAAHILWAVWTVLCWLLVQLFWLLLWLTLPIGIVAVVGVLVAERVLGRQQVRPWIRKQLGGIAGHAWRRVRSALFALWSVPLRVLVWFVIFARWYAVLNLWRTPRWTPWGRAWGRRWGYA